MKRKITAVWAAALLLSAGAANVTALAEGWAQSNGSWVYYDSNGNKIHNEWRKGADGKWRYLDGDGSMAVNVWIDGDYYVDSDGIMVTEKWLHVPEDEGEDEWYYFTESGRKVEDTWKKISDKWYHFDSNGAMERGWILDDMYYTGDDGVMRTGWQKLIPPEQYDEEINKVVPGYDTGSIDYGEDGYYWFYFGTNGKKYVPGDDNSGDDYGTRKIDGDYY